MYSWSRSIVDKKDENPFGMDEEVLNLSKMFTMEKVFVGKYKDLGIDGFKVKSTLKNYGTFNEQYQGFGNLYLDADQVKWFKIYLDKTQISNLGDIVESTTSEVTVTEYKYLIRWYDKTDGIFPKILQVFRLGKWTTTKVSQHLEKTTLITLILMNHYIFMIHQVDGVVEL